MNINNILSLFDGMGCGRLALDEAKISYNRYYASEIDKNAIELTTRRFPDTIHLGSVTDIDSNSLKDVDLLIGGSPCQGFSFAGKQLNFEDPRSKLFFEFVRLKNELNPKYFLLENVMMKKEYINIISDHLGVGPIKINSNLVSAQNRLRLYWTNIPVRLPEDKNIKLSDIIEKDSDLSKYILSDESLKKHGILEYKGIQDTCVFTETRTENAKKIRREYKKLYGKDFSGRRDKVLVPRTDGKCNCLTTSLTKEHILNDNGIIRKLTPIECERLQTVKDLYTSGFSDNQRYKMLGNGWTVEVIAHIFKNLKENKQIGLF